MNLMLILPLVMAPVAYFAGRLLRPTVSRWIALATIAVLGLLFGLVAGGSLPTSLAIDALTLRMDALSLLFVGLTLALMLLVLVYSRVEVAGEVGAEKYYALLLILTGALTGLSCATDLFNLWLWFELMVTTTFFLIAFHHDDPLALEAVIKYLVQSTLGTAFVLFGIALVLAQTGTLSLDQIHAEGIGGALLLVGFGVKLALVPLHTWLPDAYSQSPDGISVLQAGVVTQAGLIALLRTLEPLSTFAALFLIAGIANMVVGNLLALRQTDLKRLLAYSSLPHIGFIIFGIGVGLSTGTPDGIQSGLFHLLNHGLMKGLAFFAAGVLLLVLHRRRGIDRPLRIDDLAGAARSAPLASLALILALLSLAGIPPLAGFMSKWQIFAAGMTAGSPLIILLTVFAALNSLFSLAYYLPVVNVLFRSPANGDAPAQPLSLAVRLPLVVLSAVLIVVGLYPNALAWLTGPASLALFGSFS